MILAKRVTRLPTDMRSLFIAAFVSCGGLCLAADAQYSHPATVERCVSTQGASQRSPEDRKAFHVPPGFQVERVFEVPRNELGSWVCMTVDPRGRLIVSDQGRKGICRVTPAPLDRTAPTKVELLDIHVPGAQGLLCAFDSLYITVNTKDENGLYRARDTDGDDQYDELVKLKSFEGPSGEHGPHALRLSPDGKSIYIIAGNHLDPPFAPGDEWQHTHPGVLPEAEVELSSAIPTNWGEDLLLPRIWDPNGHARGCMAPGGWIARTDPDGRSWEIVSVGYRNAYDMAFNADGELFAYDSDMEWDMGLPWYRPTRIVHATHGSEFGWRSGSGVWPDYYVDSLPATLDMGPGSPTGVEFGYGARFPAKYQTALFACDWTFGTVYAVHLEPRGATYTAQREEFLLRTPLAVADIAVGADGALYFLTGGRNTQSDLFRVTYVGQEVAPAVDPHESRESQARAARRQLESQCRHATKTDIDGLWPGLSHPDRFIRYTARVALEFQPLQHWQERALTAVEPHARISAAVALARQADKSIQSRLVHALAQLPWNDLTNEQRLELLRAYQLAFIRMGRPSEADRQAILAALDPLYPASDNSLNRELLNLLVYLESPTVVPKTVPLLQQASTAVSPDSALAELIARNQTYGQPIAAMLENQPDAQRIYYAFVLRNARVGWTPELRRSYFDYLHDAASRSGGRSFVGFLKNIDRDAYEHASADERQAIDAAEMRRPLAPIELPKPMGPGQDWSLDSIVQLAEGNMRHRDFAAGRRAYAAARCIVCHRFNGDGGATGPDLTQLAGRYTLKDLTESLVNPNKTVSDQYRAWTVQTADGKTHTGRIVAENKHAIILLPDPEDLSKSIDIAPNQIESRTESPISLMPGDLLKPLNADEVLDLLAYLLSRGDADDPMFEK